MVLRKSRLWFLMVLALAAATGLVAAVPHTAAGASVQYEDVAGHPAESIIHILAAIEVLPDPEEGPFRPDADITRGDFALYLARALDVSGAAAQDFTDWDAIDEGARGRIAGAVEAGFLQGDTDGRFRPHDEITRTEMTLVFGRILFELGVEAQDRYLELFADSSEIPSWAGMITPAIRAGLVRGRPGRPKPYFDPHHPTTRAEGAIVIFRFLEIRSELLGEEMPQAPTVGGASERILSTYFFGGPQAKQRITAGPAQDANMLFHAFYKWTPEGELEGDAPQTVLQHGADNEVPVIFSIASFSHSFNDTFFGSEEIQDTAVNSIVHVLENHGFSGVNLDFENVPVHRRDEYAAFAARVAEAIRPDYLMTVALPARNHHNIQQHWAQAYDYQALGAVSDYVVVMTYDQHWNFSQPGPIGSVPWMRDAMRYATETIDADKILLGIPAYGRAWPVDGSPGTAIDLAIALGHIKLSELVKPPVFDPTLGETTFEYISRHDGVHREAWFTDAEGLAMKLELVDEFELAGVAMWRLDQELDDFWPVLTSILE